jgi:DNA-binding MarR family transcriptional regulator
MSSEGLTEEIREILKAESEPMTTAEIAERSGIAQSSSDVSKTLYGLRTGGYVERDADKRYRLVDPPPAGRKRKPRKKAASPPKDKAPAVAKPMPAETLLASNAERARETLEAYITEMGDPVLDSLFWSAANAQGALDAYRSRNDA